MKFVSVMIDREPGFVIFGDNIQHRSMFRSLENYWCGESVVKLDAAGFIQDDPNGFHPYGESTSLGVSTVELSDAGLKCLEDAKLAEVGWVVVDHAFNPNPGNTFLISKAIYSRLLEYRFKYTGAVLPSPDGGGSQKTNEEFEPYVTYREECPQKDRIAVLRTVKWLYQVEHLF